MARRAVGEHTWSILSVVPSPRVSVDSCRSNVLFEPVQLGFEVLNLLLEIFELLQASVSVVRDGHQLDQYLVMLDERAHSTEGGL